LEVAPPAKAFSAFLEQDWFQRIGPTTDRDYTMGFGVGWPGGHLADRRLRHGGEYIIDATLNFASHLIRRDTTSRRPIARLCLDDDSVAHEDAELLAGTAFTPKSLRDTLPVIGDRPYAMLLSWTTTRTTAVSDDVAYASEVTLGMIGLRLGRNSQRFIHHCMREMTSYCTKPSPDTASSPQDPKGWRNQVMDVPSIWLGWPTARYQFTRLQRNGDISAYILGNTPTNSMLADVSNEISGEIGYYTSTSAAIRARIGLFSAPFWSWREAPLSVGSVAAVANAQSKLGNLRIQSLCIDLIVTCAEGFLYGVVSGKFLLYNALLQGYPGYRGYHIAARDRTYGIAEYNFGVNTTFWFKEDKSFGIQAVDELFSHRTHEYRGAYQRGHTWGGLYLSAVWH